jgi:hypothetical protein
MKILITVILFVFTVFTVPAQSKLLSYSNDCLQKAAQENSLAKIDKERTC